MHSAFQIFGQPQPPVALLPLRAGPLTLQYDPHSGTIRSIKLGTREVLRGIYAAVRDENWGTVLGRINQTVSTINEDSFHIEFTSVHQQGNIDFLWHGKITGAATGEIRYEFTGQARSRFRRNRIGFCVLHPIAECAGARARQTRIDGQIIECRFPTHIEPQIFGKSSFQQLKTVAHEVTPEIWAEVSFSGDVFEMEDQRNWTDASFKTYCTPLALPFPVEIAAGTQIQQSVTLRILGNNSPAVATTKAAVASNVFAFEIPTTPTGRLPQLGLGVAAHGEALSQREIESLRRLKPAHLRADIRLSDPSHLAKLNQALLEAEALNSKLELALHLPRHGEPQVTELSSLLEKHQGKLSRILALKEGEAATSVETLERIHKQLAPLRVPIGAGSDCNFCELNREHALGRLGTAGADFLFWSVNPQVHAFDHCSIMETLEAQPATVASARAFAAGRELIVSPITLRQRFNPVATSSDPTVAPAELPPQVDTRQLSIFAAAWTVGSIAALATSQASSATYYETTGWRGVMEWERPSPLPDKFPSQPGMLFPIYHVFAALAGCTHFAIADCGKQNSNQIVALSLFHEQTLQRTLIANLTTELQTVAIRTANNEQKTIQLTAYAVCGIECRDGHFLEPAFIS